MVLVCSGAYESEKQRSHKVTENVSCIDSTAMTNQVVHTVGILGGHQTRLGAAHVDSKRRALGLPVHKAQGRVSGVTFPPAHRIAIWLGPHPLLLALHPPSLAPHPALPPRLKTPPNQSSHPPHFSNPSPHLSIPALVSASAPPRCIHLPPPLPLPPPPPPSSSLPWAFPLPLQHAPHNARVSPARSRAREYAPRSRSRS